MITTSDRYKSLIDEDVREESNVRLTVFNNCSSIGFIDGTHYNIPPLIDPDIVNAYYIDTYVPREDYLATLDNDGFIIGDHNCKCSESYGETSDELMYTTSVISGPGAYAFGTFKYSRKADIHFVFGDVYPTSIVYSNETHSIELECNDKFVAHKLSNNFEIGENITISFKFNYQTETIRLRVALLRLGEILVFDKDKISSVYHNIGTNLYSASLPLNSLTVNILDYEGEFDPNNPNGYYNAFNDNTYCTIEYGIGTDLFRYAMLYSGGDIGYSNNQAVLSFETFANTKLPGAYYSEQEYGNKGDDLESSTYESMFDMKFVNIDGSYYSTNAIFNNYEYYDTIKLVANSLCAYMKDARYKFMYEVYDTLKLANKKPVKHFTADDMINDYPVLEIIPKVNDKAIKKYRWYLNDAITLDNVTATIPTNETFSIEIPDDIENVICMDNSTTIDITGEYDYYWVNISTNFITNKKSVEVYVESENETVDINLTPVICTYAISTSVNTTDTASVNVFSLDNPFITNDRTYNKVSNTVDYLNQDNRSYTLTVSQDFSLEVGDVVTIDTKYESNIPIVITSIKFQLPGRFGEIVGRRIVLNE